MTNGPTTNISITLPEPVKISVDRIAKEWFSSRSATLTRIYLEWVELRTWELPPLVQAGVNQLAAERKISRSEALTKIYLEWEGGQNVPHLD